MKIQDAFEGLGTKGENPYSKIITPKALHGYLESYEYHFNAVIDRKKVKTFLELGVSRGASLIAWKRFFPNAKIIGVDSDPNALKPKMGLPFEEVAEKLLGDDFKDISIEIGDAMDKEFLESVAKKHGGFDIVLDDCSHLGIQMAISFDILWKHTRFLYVVEDLQTQFAHGVAKGHLNFSKSRRYNRDGNFITDCLQDLVTKEILPINIKDKTTFSNTRRKDISQIVTEHFIAFIYKKS